MINLKPTHLRIVLCICAVVLFINAVFGGDQFFTLRIPLVWAYTIDLLVNVCDCILYYQFFLYFRNYPDKLQQGFTRVLLYGKLYITLALFLKWISVPIFHFFTGSVHFVVVILSFLWFVSLFLKDNSPDNIFKAIKLFATLSLLSSFLVIAIFFNLVRPENILIDMTGGITFKILMLQLISATPFLLLYKFIFAKEPETGTETIPV